MHKPPESRQQLRYAFGTQFRFRKSSRIADGMRLLGSHRFALFEHTMQRSLSRFPAGLSQTFCSLRPFPQAIPANADRSPCRGDP